MRTRNTTQHAVMRLNSLLLVGVFIIVATVVGSEFAISSSAQRNGKGLGQTWSSGAANSPASNSVGAKPVDGDVQRLLKSGSSLFRLSAPLVPQGGPETIATYQGNCTTTQDQFTVGDIVCAKVTNISSQPRRIYWVNPDDHVVQIDTVNPTSTTGSRSVNQVGKWRVYLVDASDGSARAVAVFSVSDPQNPAVDLAVVKASGDGTFTAGGFARYTIAVANNGPDTANSVNLSETTPNNTTFVGVTKEDAGAASFTCTPGSPTVCTSASLAAGASATFTFVYQVDASAPVGTVIENTASVTSQTAELNPEDNTTKIAGTVTSAGGAGGTVCTVSCPDDITTPANTTDQNGNSGAIVHFSPPSGNDECGVIVVDHCNDCFFPVGTTTVTATATTGDSCSFAVTVTPATTGAPTITCPSNKTASADSNCQAMVDPGQPTTTGDNVTVSGSRSDEQPLSAPYPSGTTTITWKATNSSGSASCQQTITVNDTTPPTITCPANVTQGTDPGSCSATVDPGTATATDNCDPNPTVSALRSDDQPLNAPYPKGTTTITWSAVDDSGNLSSCTQTVTVKDTENPVIACPANITQPNDAGSCSANVNPGTATATDNCDSNPTVAGTRSDNQSLSSPYPVGTTTITWKATDSSGNSSSCTQTVTVNDTENPTITAPTNVTAYTGPGATSCDTVVSDATLGTASANDNCPGVTVSRSPSGNTFPVGTTTVTWTATDAHGNTATATQTVTVIDNTPPVVTPPANVTAFTGPGATSCGTVVSDSTLGTASATDNCPGVSGVTRTGVPSGNFFPVGTTTITYSASDASGNSASATQTVTVIDNTPPVVTPPANVTAYTGPGATSCDTVVSDATLGTASANDNCPGVTVSRSPSGNTFPVGTTTVTWTATDAHGNTATATQTVTVIDNTPPVISCPANITLEPTCPSGAIATYTTPVGTDNCPGATTTRTAGLASGSVFPIGTTTVTYTANDAHGNSTSCSFTVTVKTPAAVIQDLINRVQALIDQGVLNQPNGQGLLSKLNAALSDLNSGNTAKACNDLDSFIDKVQGFITHGTLTSAQGQPLIDSAKHAQNGLGCKPVNCT